MIGIHIGAMYLPSPLTGYLVDRISRLPMLTAAGVTLLAAGVTAAFAPDTSVFALAAALALLGLGWNLGLVGGTAMVADAVPVASRAKTQGSVDLCVALAGATGGVTSGLVLSASSYATLSLLGAVLGIALLPLAAWSRNRVTEPLTLASVARPAAYREQSTGH